MAFNSIPFSLCLVSIYICIYVRDTYQLYTIYLRGKGRKGLNSTPFFSAKSKQSVKLAKQWRERKLARPRRLLRLNETFFLTHREKTDRAD